MKIVGWILFLLIWNVVFAAWIGQFSISFHPEFHMALPKWKLSLAMIFFGLAISLFYLQVFEDGYKAGNDHVVNVLERKVNELTEE